MNRIDSKIEDLELKIDIVKNKIKSKKIINKNCTADCKKLVFAESIYGTNKILTYDFTAYSGQSQDIIVKIDDVVINTINGLLAYGEILLKANKMYNLKIECVGENLLAGKLVLECADLKTI